MVRAKPVTLPYRCQSRGRSPMHLGLLVAAAGLFVIGLVKVAPLSFLLTTGFFAAVLAYLEFRAPRAGIEIDRRSVTLWQGLRRKRIAVAAIERVELREKAAGVEATVLRRDGDRIDIPEPCQPEPKLLRAALEAAGVAVTAS